MNFFNFRKNAEVAVIDFGSSKIVVFVGKKTPDGFLIVARGESKYAGFYDGEWLEPERLSDAVSYALRQAEQSYGRQIREVFVGVPGEFTSVTVGEATNLYRFKKRITKDDVNEIYKKTDIFDGDKKFLPIGRSDLFHSGRQRGRRRPDRSDGEQNGRSDILLFCFPRFHGRCRGNS